MELDPEYTFIPLIPRHYLGFENKETKEYFKKWGLTDNISVQDFSFNEEYQPYNKYQIAEKFFKNAAVANALLLKDGNTWMNKNIKAASVEVENIPCTVINMSFFDRLKDVDNNIILNSGKIRQRFETVVDGHFVSDNLKSMLLDEECEEYGLYTEEERKEFIFRLFEMFVLGGNLCQYEDELKPYLDVTKNIYKDLIRVHMQEESYNLSVGTTVLEVVAKNPEGEPFFPTDPDIRRNIGFLLIDGSNRQITTFLHQLGTFRW